MNDSYLTSVLGDDYGAITSIFELFIGPWLLSMLAAWVVQYLAGRYGSYSVEPAYRASVFYGTWLFYLFINIRLLGAAVSPEALFIRAVFFFPLPAFMIPCTIYYVRTIRARGARSLVVVALFATTGIAAQIGWLCYIVANG